MIYIALTFGFILRFRQMIATGIKVDLSEDY